MIIAQEWTGTSVSLTDVQDGDTLLWLQQCDYSTQHSDEYSLSFSPSGITVSLDNYDNEPAQPIQWKLVAKRLSVSSPGPYTATLTATANMQNASLVKGYQVRGVLAIGEHSNQYIGFSTGHGFGWPWTCDPTDFSADELFCLHTNFGTPPAGGTEIASYQAQSGTVKAYKYGPRTESVTFPSSLDPNGGVFIVLLGEAGGEEDDDPDTIPPQWGDNSDPNAGAEDEHTPSAIIAGNQFVACTHHAIEAALYNRLRIDGNTIAAGGEQAAVYLDNVDDSSISGNLITKHDGAGIIATGCEYMTIDANHLHDTCQAADNTGMYPIEIIGGTKGKIQGNRVTSTETAPAYAIRISATCSDISAIDNDLRFGYATGAISDEGAGSVTIRNLPEPPFIEQVADAAAAIFQDSTTIDFTYDAEAHTIAASAIDGTIAPAAHTHTIADITDYTAPAPVTSTFGWLTGDDAGLIEVG